MLWRKKNFRDTDKYLFNMTMRYLFANIWNYKQMRDDNDLFYPASSQTPKFKFRIFENKSGAKFKNRGVNSSEKFTLSHLNTFPLTVSNLQLTISRVFMNIRCQNLMWFLISWIKFNFHFWKRRNFCKVDFVVTHFTIEINTVEPCQPRSCSFYKNWLRFESLKLFIKDF